MAQYFHSIIFNFVDQIEQTSVKSLIEDPSDTQVEVLQKLEPEFDSQAISQPEQDANKKIFVRKKIHYFKFIISINNKIYK